MQGKQSRGVPWLVREVSRRFTPSSGLQGDEGKRMEDLFKYIDPVPLCEKWINE